MKSGFKQVLTGRPFRWVVGTVAALFVLYLLLGYFAVDPLAKKLLPWFAENKLASRMTVERVEFDPLRLILTVDKLNLTRHDGKPLAGLGQLHVDLEAGGLFRRAWHIRDIRLTQPSAHLEIGQDGKLNWAELLAKLNENKEPDDGTIPRLLLDHILIEQGSVHYAEHNRPTPFVTELSPLALELDGFSTLPQDRGNYLIAARMPDQGATLRWKGTFGANPVSSAGEIQLSGLKLTKLAQAIRKETLPVNVTAGELGATLHYDFAMVSVPDQPEPKPQALLSQVALTLSQLAAELNPHTQVSLEQMNAMLPQLDLALHEGGRIHMQGLQVQADKLALTQQDKSLFALEHLKVDDIAYSVADNKLDIAQIALEQGQVAAVRGQDGVLDWQTVGPEIPAADTTQAASEPEPEANPFRFNIGSIRLQQWKAAFEDRTFVKPLRLGVDNIDVALAVRDEGEGIAVDAIEVGLGKLALNSPLAPQPVARLADIRIAEGSVTLADRTVKLPAITISGLETSVTVDAERAINWLAILETVPAKTAPAPASAATPGSAWNVALDSLRLENTSVHIEDKSQGAPVVLDIQNGQVELRNASLDLAKPIPLKAGFKIKQGGRFSADGKLAPAPLKGDLNLKLEGLPLTPFSPYLNRQALLKLTSGEAVVRGKLSLKPAKALSGQFMGGFNVQNLEITHEADNRPFLSWKSVSTNSLRLGLAPNRLHMDELRVEHPVGSIIIFEDRSMNVQRLLRPATENQPAPAATSDTSGEPFPVSVNRLSITDADLEFADLSLAPQFGTHMHTLGGVINGLSTDPTSAAQVELDGKVDDYGSARVRGALQPFRATENTDLKVAFRNLEMNRLTPYSGKFAGRKIDSGKMSVDLEYKIKNRQLSGENKFVINTLKLGERVESPDAVNLPLDLAITLLEDSNGIIDLDLPISGSLDDPQFSYGKIVWKAIINVISKVATAPFRALGKLLGISSEKLEAIAFDSGESGLLPPEQEKLKLLADAMTKKTALALRVTPAFDPAADKAALQEQATRRAVLKEMGLTLKDGEQPGPVDLNNVKVQTAVENLHKDLKGESRSLKAVDAVRDYFRKPKPEDMPRYEAMLKELKDAAKVTDAELHALAKSRAEAIRGYLTSKGGLAAERVTLAEIDKATSDGKTVPLKMELGVAKGDQ
jgi:uncharacterized protein involved in outer membrane biogenesis